MASKEEELLAAVKLLKKHCTEVGTDCGECPLLDWCCAIDGPNPEEWPDPD